MVDHLPRAEVCWSHLAAVIRDGVGIGVGDKPKIPDEPFTVQFVKVAGFDVPVADVVLLLQRR